MFLWQFELIFLRFCLNNFSLPSGRGYFSQGTKGVGNVFGAIKPFLFSLPHPIDDLKSSAKSMFYRRKHTKTCERLRRDQKILKILPRTKFWFVCWGGIFNLAWKNSEKSSSKMWPRWRLFIFDRKYCIDSPSKLFCIQLKHFFPRDFLSTAPLLSCVLI